MYYLILIVSFVANGPSLQMDHIEFNSKSDCQEALIEVLNDYERNPISRKVMSEQSAMHIDAWCVAKGDE